VSLENIKKILKAGLTKLLLYSKSKHFCVDIDCRQAKTDKIFEGEFRNASTKHHCVSCGTLEFYSNSALQ